jgi:hypothetical protein
MNRYIYNVCISKNVLSIYYRRSIIQSPYCYIYITGRFSIPIYTISISAKDRCAITIILATLTPSIIIALQPAITHPSVLTLKDVKYMPYIYKVQKRRYIFVH